LNLCREVEKKQQQKTKRKHQKKTQKNPKQNTPPSPEIWGIGIDKIVQNIQYSTHAQSSQL
jgi:hypothetical protein